MPLSVVTLILAGGQSSRMGRDKALLPIQGIPLIRRIYDVVEPCCTPVYVVSPWGDRYRSVLPPACQFLKEDLPEDLSENLPEDLPENLPEDLAAQSALGANDLSPKPLREKQSLSLNTHGPLIGFYQGLSQIMALSPIETNSVQSATTSWVLLLACDLPNLQTDVIQEWCDRLTHCAPSTIALLPIHPTKGWHPLCGFYRYRCLSSLKSFIDRGGRSFQKWLVNEEVRSLSVSDPSLLFNCNTPEEARHVGYCIKGNNGQ